MTDLIRTTKCISCGKKIKKRETSREVETTSGGEIRKRTVHYHCIQKMPSLWKLSY